jgi:hypothetical protein
MGFTRDESAVNCNTALGYGCYEFPDTDQDEVPAQPASVDGDRRYRDAG